jgi:hypothetical protein
MIKQIRSVMGGPAGFLLAEPPAPPIRYLKGSAKLDHPFQCGKHVAHCQPGNATTTAGRKPTRQCFAFIYPVRRLTSDRVRVFEHIVKKRTQAKASNRLERRVPDSEELTLHGSFALETTVNVSFAQNLHCRESK